MGVQGTRCVPTPGFKQARCYITVASIFSPLPEDPTDTLQVVEDR